MSHPAASSTMLGNVDSPYPTDIGKNPEQARPPKANKAMPTPALWAAGASRRAAQMAQGTATEMRVERILPDTRAISSRPKVTAAQKAASASLAEAGFMPRLTNRVVPQLPNMVSATP